MCPTCKVSNKEILPDPSPSSPSIPISNAEQSRSETTSSPPAVPESTSNVSERVEPVQAESAGKADSEKRDTSSIELDRPTTVPSGVPNVRTEPSPNVLPMSNVAARRRSREHPPLLLDTAILVLLAIVFVIICRRININY